MQYQRVRGPTSAGGYPLKMRSSSATMLGDAAVAGRAYESIVTFCEAPGDAGGRGFVCFDYRVTRRIYCEFPRLN